MKDTIGQDSPEFSENASFWNNDASINGRRIWGYKRIEFCKTITHMYEDGRLNVKQIIFSVEAHFRFYG